MKKRTKIFLTASAATIVVASAITTTTLFCLSQKSTNSEAKTWDQVNQLVSDIDYQYKDNLNIENQKVPEIKEEKQKMAQDFQQTMNEIVDYTKSSTEVYNNLLTFANENGLSVVDWSQMESTVQQAENDLVMQINSMDDIDYETKQDEINNVRSRIDNTIDFCKEKNYNVNQTCDYFYDQTDVLVPATTNQQKKLKTNLVLNKIVHNSEKEDESSNKLLNTNEEEKFFLDELKQQPGFAVGNDVSSYLNKINYLETEHNKILENDYGDQYKLVATCKIM